MEDRKTIIEKKIECIIGLFFLIPPIIGVVAFILSLIDPYMDFANLDFLRANWTACYGYDEGGGGGMSAAPIYLAIMAFVGAYLIKDKLRYFIKDKKEENPIQEKINE